MFDDKFFDDWLDSQAQKVMEKVASGEGIAPEQMMVLMLKAQTNHFAHLDVDLRNEMVLLREDMDKRFEQVDKRFEQVDKRFEQQHQEVMRLHHEIKLLMRWSFGTLLAIGGLIVAVLRLAP